MQQPQQQQQWRAGSALPPPPPRRWLLPAPANRCAAAGAGAAQTGRRSPGRLILPVVSSCLDHPTPPHPHLHFPALLLPPRPTATPPQVRRGRRAAADGRGAQAAAAWCGGCGAGCVGCRRGGGRGARAGRDGVAGHAGAALLRRRVQPQDQPQRAAGAAGWLAGRVCVCVWCVCRRRGLGGVGTCTHW